VRKDKLLEELEEVCGTAGDAKWHRVIFVLEKPGEIDAKRIRESLDMSQHEFAAKFGISVGTLRNWEQGLRVPDGPARAYLAVIKHEPEAVLKSLEKERPKVIDVTSHQNRSSMRASSE